MRLSGSLTKAASEAGDPSPQMEPMEEESVDENGKDELDAIATRMECEA